MINLLGTPTPEPACNGVSQLWCWDLKYKAVKFTPSIPSNIIWKTAVFCGPLDPDWAPQVKQQISCTN